MASEYAIGATEEALATLDTLVELDPQMTPAQYAGYVTTGDGLTRGVGWLEAEWRWDFIRITDIANLRAYCADTSAEVYLTTPNIDGDFTTYSAIMVWPQSPEALFGDMYQDFAIRFVQLIEQPGSGTGS